MRSFGLRGLAMKQHRFNRAYLFIAASVAALSSTASAATFDVDSISFRDITGAIEIVTTTGDNIEIEVMQGNVFRTLSMAEDNGVLVVTGEREPITEDLDCCDRRINREFHGRKDRELTTGEPLDEEFFKAYPTIKVLMPATGNVEMLDAYIKIDMDNLNGSLTLDACYAYGQTGDLDEAVIGLVDGSRLVIGNVDAGLEIDMSGDADLLVGDAAIVDVDLAGPADVILGDIDGMLDVSIAGSGIVRSTRVDGPLTTRIAGSGGVAVKAGSADKLRATIDGSGGVYFGGVVNQPELRLYGSSEVRMRNVTGRITHHGGGDVYVGDEVFGSDDEE